MAGAGATLAVFGYLEQISSANLNLHALNKNNTPEGKLVRLLRLLVGKLFFSIVA